jgi:hypothetical protein
VQVLYVAKICLVSHTCAYGPLHRWMSLYVDLAYFLVGSGCTGKNDLTRRVTHREAVFATVIHSIFDAWHYECPMDLQVD